eukprot:3790335-Rhodomonas_salina.4
MAKAGSDSESESESECLSLMSLRLPCQAWRPAGRQVQALKYPGTRCNGYPLQLDLRQRD